MSAKYLLTHERGHLGPKTIDEWAVANGDEPLLLWMLRELETQGVERVELVAVRDYDERVALAESQRDEMPPPPKIVNLNFYEELRPT